MACTLRRQAIGQFKEFSANEKCLLTEYLVNLRAF